MTAHITTNIATYQAQCNTQHISSEVRVVAQPIIDVTPKMAASGMLIFFVVGIIIGAYKDGLTGAVLGFCASGLLYTTLGLLFVLTSIAFS